LWRSLKIKSLIAQALGLVEASLDKSGSNTVASPSGVYDEVPDLTEAFHRRKTVKGAKTCASDDQTVITFVARDDVDRAWRFVNSRDVIQATKCAGENGSSFFISTNSPADHLCHDVPILGTYRADHDVFCRHHSQCSDI
jgi:hypothetical protein